MTQNLSLADYNCSLSAQGLEKKVNPLHSLMWSIFDIAAYTRRDTVNLFGQDGIASAIFSEAKESYETDANFRNYILSLNILPNTSTKEAHQKRLRLEFLTILEAITCYNEEDQGALVEKRLSYIKGLVQDDGVIIREPVNLKPFTFEQVSRICEELLLYTVSRLREIDFIVIKNNGVSLDTFLTQDGEIYGTTNEFSFGVIAKFVRSPSGSQSYNSLGVCTAHNNILPEVQSYFKKTDFRLLWFMLTKLPGTIKLGKDCTLKSLTLAPKKCAFDRTPGDRLKQLSTILDPYLFEGFGRKKSNLNELQCALETISKPSSPDTIFDMNVLAAYIAQCVGKYENIQFSKDQVDTVASGLVDEFYSKANKNETLLKISYDSIRGLLEMMEARQLPDNPKTLKNHALETFNIWKVKFYDSILAITTTLPILTDENSSFKSMMDSKEIEEAEMAVDQFEKVELVKDKRTNEFLDDVAKYAKIDDIDICSQYISEFNGLIIDLASTDQTYIRSYLYSKEDDIEALATCLENQIVAGKRMEDIVDKATKDIVNQLQSTEVSGKVVSADGIRRIRRELNSIWNALSLYKSENGSEDLNSALQEATRINSILEKQERAAEREQRAGDKEIAEVEGNLPDEDDVIAEYTRNIIFSELNTLLLNLVHLPADISAEALQTRPFWKNLIQDLRIASMDRLPMYSAVQIGDFRAKLEGLKDSMTFKIHPKVSELYDGGSGPLAHTLNSLINPARPLMNSTLNYATYLQTFEIFIHSIVIMLRTLQQDAEDKVGQNLLDYRAFFKSLLSDFLSAWENETEGGRLQIGKRFIRLKTVNPGEDSDSEDGGDSGGGESGDGTGSGSGGGGGNSVPKYKTPFEWVNPDIDDVTPKIRHPRKIEVEGKTDRNFQLDALNLAGELTDALQDFEPTLQNDQKALIGYEQSMSIAKLYSEGDKINKNLFLYNDTGTGKTLSSLLVIHTAVKKIQDYRKYLFTLYIVTNTQILGNWKSSILKFNQILPLFFDSSLFEIYTMTYPTYRTMIEKDHSFERDKAQPYFVILDEVHSYVYKPNDKAKRDQVRLLCDHISKAQKTVLLSATPIERGVFELSWYYMMLLGEKYDAKMIESAEAFFKTFDDNPDFSQKDQMERFASIMQCRFLRVTLGTSETDPITYNPLNNYVYIMKKNDTTEPYNNEYGNTEEDEDLNWMKLGDLVENRQSKYAYLGHVTKVIMTKEETKTYFLAHLKDRQVKKNSPDQFSLGKAFYINSQKACETESKVDHLVDLINKHKQSCDNEGRIMKVLIYSGLVEENLRGTKYLQKALKKKVAAGKLVKVNVDRYDGEGEEEGPRNKFNKYTNEVQVLLFSNKGTMGLDYKNVSLLVLMQPPNSYKTYLQILGRAARVGSHDGLVAYNKKYNTKIQLIVRTEMLVAVWDPETASEKIKEDILNKAPLSDQLGLFTSNYTQLMRLFHRNIKIKRFSDIAAYTSAQTLGPNSICQTRYPTFLGEKD